jgi:predicted PurR-regulated permease PerM
MATTLQRRFLLAVVIFAVAMTVILVSPFWTALLVAAALAAAARAPMALLTGRLRLRRELAAGLLVILLIAAIILPMTALLTVIASQTLEGFQWLREALSSEGITGLVARLPRWLEVLVRQAIAAVPDLEAELKRLAGSGGGQAVAALGGLLAATGGALVKLGVTLIALYFFLVDGHKLVAWLDRVVPLAPGQFAEFTAEFRRTAVSVLVATVATAGIQAAAALVGFLISQAPGPLFLTTVTFLVALVPAVGGTIVVVAVAMLQYFTGHGWSAIFLLVWGFGVVSMVDTFARPYLLRGGMELPIGIVFLALLGGVAAFGLVGVVLGPLTVTFLLAALRIFRREQDAEAAPRTDPAAYQD